MTELDRAERMLAKWRKNQAGVRFADLERVCQVYFGKPRRKGSHLVYRTPWQRVPFVNIQNYRGQAKPYQVRQVLKAVYLKESENEIRNKDNEHNR